ERARARYGPDHLTVIVNMSNEAEALALRGRYDEAARLADDTVARAPQYANLWDTVATIRRARGDRDGALVAARRGVATCDVQGPRWCQHLRIVLGEILADAGTLGEAAAELDHAAAIAGAPEPFLDARQHFARARIARARGRATEADAESARALVVLA